MMISAEAEAWESDRLDRALDLYRSLTLQLQQAITALQANAGDEAGKGCGGIVLTHAKSLQQVLDLEERLGKRTKAAGGVVELDLDAARAEIRARLARWVAER